MVDITPGVDILKVSGVGCRVSGVRFSTVAGLEIGQSDRWKKLCRNEYRISNNESRMSK